MKYKVSYTYQSWGKNHPNGVHTSCDEIEADSGLDAKRRVENRRGTIEVKSVTRVRRNAAQ